MNHWQQRIEMLRDGMVQILKAPGAIKIDQGKKKIRFYDWCLSQEDGWEKFQLYTAEKRKNGYDDEGGFAAAGWVE